MTKQQEMVISLVLTQVSSQQSVEEKDIENCVKIFSVCNPMTVVETEEVIVELHSKLKIRMDRGACVKELNHKPWFYSQKAKLNMAFWNRYRQYLQSHLHFNSDIVDTLDKSTDEIVDLLGNPSTDFAFQRRGLVIGDVQSGKTATYTALINKAADAGYKVIILLTGTIEKLRKQTQVRIDAGFVGLDSSALIKEKDTIPVGVGTIDPSIQGFVLTSTSGDFNKATANKLGFRLNSIKDPLILVIKKNKSVLEKLEQWLKLYNAKKSEAIDSPLLLIDDEADSASVNTKKEDEDPTAINAAIRKLLKLFVKANYVGFTATPFANIFINPESTNEMLLDDLFPKHFIYALQAPTNYVGARGVFEQGGKYHYMVKTIEDCDAYFPEKHTIDFIPNKLPPSLIEAIASFMIANAIRDLRKQTEKHRSMLINVSRFINVQIKIEKLVDSFVRETQREIINYYKCGVSALQYDKFKLLHSVFDKHFTKCNYKWEKVQEAMHNAIAPIVVRSVNSRNASKNMDYEDNDENGLRIIAIGGYSLSRGLTLEGLCTSYFFRNSKMYDTLMQMGRWFGYRDGYNDLCQVWMSEDAEEWYKYISVAADELKNEVKRMQDAMKTPNDFGLRVRSDINALIVTARNKMRHTKEYEAQVCLNGEMVETPFLFKDKLNNKINRDATIFFLQNLQKLGHNAEQSEFGNTIIKNVPKQLITEFLINFNSHYQNSYFRTDELRQFIISENSGYLDNWDITFAQGNGDPITFANIKTCPINRRFIIRGNNNALQISGKNSRLGSVTIAKEGLTKLKADEIEKEYKKENPNKGIFQELYFRKAGKRNPLLVIYLVNITNENKQDDLQKEEKAKLISDLNLPLIGLSIGIPLIVGVESKLICYKINLIKFRELFENSNDYTDDDLSEEEVRT